ncbi:hypothetical protein DCAR_0624318 [Daucus carota subsp. sativus]|uniref:Glycosyltransferase n=1 Tax=Daucus carota subsp. sativus TaxID=79200 RepID=A0AAF0XEL3_DAUCS|nr:PREDICTED: UDP-glycosyltransferase 85A8-like [Daucus carota subsp. sativus]WOH04906.1 hypothetical protein DCAR_0624318 [Daucus carota subsp. sativus]
MGSNKPHAMCIPVPTQGHISPMLKLAKLLHHKGFHISFVNTEFNHRRLLHSRGPAALDGLPDFRYYAIPDGIPPSDPNATQSPPLIFSYTPVHCLKPITSLVSQFNEANVDSDVPPVTCIIADGLMTFALKVADQFRIAKVLFWTASTCGLLAYSQYGQLVERGYTPLKDESYVTNGYLDAIVDGIPGMKDMKLRDFPSFVRTTDINDIMFNHLKNEAQAISNCDALIIHTFDALEKDSVDALLPIQPHIYTVGPMLNNMQDEKLKFMGSNLWKEEISCFDWLDQREANSVLYVNFGSITVMSAKHLSEFAWGLAKSKKHFLWIIRPDVVSGDSAMLAPEFLSETENRGVIASWCPQEQVLNHPAIAGFLTHSGWNSTIESIAAGVPMISWPFFAEQQTNCRYCCVEWGIGMEINNEVKRDEVEVLVRELMDGEKGKMMKENVMDFKKKAQEAMGPNGSSLKNFNRLINEVLLPR